MHILCILLGVLFGAAEFLLTKAIVARATGGKTPVWQVAAKILSYAAVLPPILILAPRAFALRFAVSAAVALPVTGAVMFLYHPIRERGDDDAG